MVEPAQEQNTDVSEQKQKQNVAAEKKSPKQKRSNSKKRKDQKEKSKPKVSYQARLEKVEKNLEVLGNAFQTVIAELENASLLAMANSNKIDALIRYTEKEGLEGKLDIAKLHQYATEIRAEAVKLHEKNKQMNQIKNEEVKDDE